MKLTQPPAQFIHKSDGNRIFEVSPLGSRYGVISVKELDNQIKVRTIEDGTEQMDEFCATLTNQSLRGVDPEYRERREIDDDIQDLLHILGYTVVDQDVRSY